MANRGERRERAVHYCSCGKPLHYPNARTRRYTEQLIRTLGPTITIPTTEGAWRVPYHYLALHTVRLWELPQLAEQYGWERIEEEDSPEPTLLDDRGGIKR